MLVYFVLVLIPVITVAVQKFIVSDRYLYDERRLFSQKKQRNTAVVLFFVFFFILLALRREDVGTDIVSYIKYFRASRDYGLFEFLKFFSNEHGFYVLLKIINMLAFGNEQLFLAIIAAATVFPLMYFYTKESENQLITISFFLILPVFTMQFSGLRQALAIALIVPAYYMVKQRKLLKFVLIVILASLFHLSALVALVLYPIYYIKWSRKMLFFIVPAIAVIYYFNAPIYIFLVSVLGEEYAGYGEISETGAFMMLLLFILCFVFSYFMMDNEKADEDTKGLRNILVVATALQCFSISNPIASRMNYYFMVFIPVLIPKIINRSSEKNRKWANIIGTVMICYFIFYFFRRAYTGADILNTFPYYAFWQTY